MPRRTRREASSIGNALKKLYLFIAAALFSAALGPACAAPCAGAAVLPAGFCYHSPEILRLAGFEILDKGCCLFIDLDTCSMIIFLDGRPLRWYPVSGGTRETPSPVGTWRVVEISDWGEGFGGSWIGLDVPWGTYGIHGTVEPWSVGEYNVSHGCIRMRDTDAAEVKALVSYGDLVFIKQDSVPFRELSHGMTGSDVMQTQKMLAELAYYFGPPDGVYGDATELAVRQFQWKNGLKEDGIVGKATCDRLRALSGA